MIALQRRRSLIPQGLIEFAEEETRKLVAKKFSLERQSRLRFEPKTWMEFLSSLMRMSHNKCAYCETPLEGERDRPHIDHFRPIHSVAESSDHPGYFWLAYSWHNLMPACPICSHNKRDYFPLASERNRITNPKDLFLGKERPLLLNPCMPWFNASRYMRFDTRTGKLIHMHPRGAATIGILGLNREELIHHRHRVCIQVKKELKKLLSINRKITARELQQMMREFSAPGARYAGIARQVVSEFMDEHMPGHRDQVRHMRDPEWIRLIPKLDQRMSVSIEPSLPTGHGFITRIEINNFKCIKKLKLQFEFARDERVGWQVFLGENGAGKSSVLQAIALCLGGQPHLESDWLKSHSLLHDGVARTGSVKVQLSTDAVPIQINFTKEGIKYTAGHAGTKMFLRGYGAVRLPPKHNDSNPYQSDGETRLIQNLFDPHYPLCNADEWLRGLNGQDFERVALTLKDVLSFGAEENIILNRGNDGNVRVTTPHRALGTLRSLSRGQQAVLDLAVDIMAGILKERQGTNDPAAPNDYRQAAGIVLLDEIDAHLHPRWKMEIVPALRKAFPNIQFLVTTHEPLCLRGLEEREIVIMRASQGIVEAEISDVSPKGWRVDQLLTSTLFGLHSTIDPDLDKKFRRYYALLAMPSCTTEEAVERDVLASNLQSENRLGYTRRDQMLYEIIDQCLAKEEKLSYNQRRALHDRTKDKVANLWYRLTAGSRKA